VINLTPSLQLLDLPSYAHLHSCKAVRIVTGMGTPAKTDTELRFGDNPSLTEEDRRELEAARQERRAPRTSAVGFARALMEEHEDVFRRLAQD